MVKPRTLHTQPFARRMASSAYTPRELNIAEGQLSKLNTAVRKNRGVKLTFVNGPIRENLQGEELRSGVFLLSKAQLQRLVKEQTSTPPGTAIKISFSKDQVHANSKHVGGFLSILAGE